MGTKVDLFLSCTVATLSGHILHNGELLCSLLYQTSRQSVKLLKLFQRARRCVKQVLTEHPK